MSGTATLKVPRSFLHNLSRRRHNRPSLFLTGYNCDEAAVLSQAAKASSSIFSCVRAGGATVLSVNLLGGSRVARNNEQIWSDLGPAGRRLAGFLFTFPDRPHRRERLIDLFWPELDPSEGAAP